MHKRDLRSQATEISILQGDESRGDSDEEECAGANQEPALRFMELRRGPALRKVADEVLRESHPWGPSQNMVCGSDTLNRDCSSRGAILLQSLFNISEPQTIV